MSLPNVIINLGNGGLGRVSSTDDGVAGLILTGKAVTGKLELNKVYTLSSTLDFTTLGVTVADNPLVYKEVSAFYAQAGDGAELYLTVVDEEKTLAEMCSMDADSPMRQIIDAAAGRIRLLGVNRNPEDDYEPDMENELDKDVVKGAENAQALAESYAGNMWPFRVFLPALAWSGKTTGMYKPREASFNRVGIVLASDGQVGDKENGFSKLYSAAVGQVLGRAASVSVNVSIARVRDGAIAASGYLCDGETPESHNASWGALDESGYIFYRTFIGKSGYYLNDDHLAAPESDDYSSLNLGRVIDKAIILAYTTYIDYVMDNIAVDENGKIPVGICKDFEAAIISSVNAQMSGEISSFEAYINPEQNLISTGQMDISCSIVPTSILRKINVNLSFNNPFE